MMEDKQKLRDDELKQTAGGADPDIDEPRYLYCTNCNCYRNKKGEYTLVKHGCSKTAFCKTCGTELINI